jgi:hypothetical protein
MSMLYPLFRAGIIVEIDDKYFWIQDDHQTQLHPFVQKGGVEGLPYLFQGMYENMTKVKFINTFLGDESKPKFNQALNDQFEPASSEDKSALYVHWWPKKNTEEFIEYTFDQEYTISESKVYWYDDSPFGGCRIPASWELLYKQGNDWVPVKTVAPYEISKDKYNIVQFEPVKTSAVRMKVKLPVNHATGVHEWIVK